MNKNLIGELIQIENRYLPIIQILENKSEYKELYRGFMTFQSEINSNPDILFLGINPGDGAFNENTPYLPSPILTHDIYSIQAQGLGGTFRPFRNDVGYVYDEQIDNKIKLSLDCKINYKIKISNYSKDNDKEFNRIMYSNNEGTIDLDLYDEPDSEGITFRYVNTLLNHPSRELL